MGALGDVRYALRSLAKNPGFAAVALLTIALGVGANTAVFSVVNAVLLRPLPYPDADRLIAIHEIDPRAPREWREVSYPNFLDWQRAMQTVEGMAAWSAYRFTLEAGDQPISVEAARMSWNYFDVLGVRPLRGRSFEAQDDDPHAAPVVMISEALWAQLFQRDPSAIGRAVRLNGTSATIIGIMPTGFGGPPDMTAIQDVAQVWTTIGRFLPTGSLSGRGAPFLTPIVARLRPGVTRQQADDEIKRIAAELERLYPNENRNRSATAASMQDQFYRQIRPMLLILFGAVSFVLSIACVNLASLLLARGGARAREFALRASVGASRRHIVRLVLAESLTLAILGGALGLLLAAWIVDALIVLSPVSLPSFVRVGLDGRVLAFTGVVCLASGLLFGLAPAVLGSKADLLFALKGNPTHHGTRGLMSSVAPFLRRRLVVAEIALALVLLVGAGLMLRTLDQLRAIDPGFRLQGLLRVSLWFPSDPPGTQGSADRSVALARALLDRVEGLPTVQDAALSWFGMPLSNGWLQVLVQMGPNAESIPVRRHLITPGYFRTMGIPIAQGRDFTADDVRTSEPYVAIVSQRLAKRFWPEGITTGSAVTGREPPVLRYNNRTYEIVGVAGDVRFTSLLEPAASDADLYCPLYQTSNRTFGVIGRTSGSPEPVIEAIRRIIAELSSGAVVTRVETGETLFGAHVVRQRFTGALLSTFALVALALTLVGVYGVTAYNVNRQTRDIGIRMALGATRRDVLAAVLKGELAFVLHGLVIGVVAGLALTGVLSGLIYGVSRTDPTTFASVALLVAVVAIVACLIPARWATRIDPVVALRVE